KGTRERAADAVVFVPRSPMQEGKAARIGAEGQGERPLVKTGEWSVEIGNRELLPENAPPDSGGIITGLQRPTAEKHAADFPNADVAVGVPHHTPRNHASDIALVRCLQLNPNFLWLTRRRFRRWRLERRTQCIGAKRFAIEAGQPLFRTRHPYPLIGEQCFIEIVGVSARARPNIGMQTFD